MKNICVISIMLITILLGSNKLLAQKTDISRYAGNNIKVEKKVEKKKKRWRGLFKRQQKLPEPVIVVLDSLPLKLEKDSILAVIPAIKFELSPFMDTLFTIRENMNFLYNQVKLTPNDSAIIIIGDSAIVLSAKEYFHAIAEIMVKYKDVLAFDVIGASCNCGTDSVNDGLSFKRAMVGRAFLIAGGITSNIHLHSFGSRHPIYPGECNELTKEHEARNRYLKLSFHYLDWVDKDDPDIIKKLPKITIRKDGVVIKQYLVDEIDLPTFAWGRIWDRMLKKKNKRKK